MDTLLQSIQALNSSLASPALKIPRGVHTALLEAAVAHIAEQLVEAYAAVKKANDEGRALMARDVKVLQAALTNLISRGALPAKSLSLLYAESWVGALAIGSGDELVRWAKGAPSSYSIKHLTPIVMSVGTLASSMRKKEQQELVAALQDVAMGRG